MLKWKFSFKFYLNKQLICAVALSHKIMVSSVTIIYWLTHFKLQWNFGEKYFIDFDMVTIKMLPGKVENNSKVLLKIVTENGDDKIPFQARIKRITLNSKKDFPNTKSTLNWNKSMMQSQRRFIFYFYSPNLARSKMKTRSLLSQAGNKELRMGHDVQSILQVKGKC